ncbi:hypothetical protein H8F21_16195 [Pseudomonas sp. P66]|uniref:Uncharacterized protein n=2 Tax=Pseudomonas arcuscaelestis TaxID=2710591 RepID=A0ABS2C0A5_9PSED|nr:hypothetical protein [Pseudomonas arcuscaelestis]
MAIIDDLRHRQLLVNDHLDLHQRRDELSLRLRLFYTGQGIEATDELIERGVREHFSKRLAYEAPKLGLTGRLVFKLVSNRKVVLRRIGLGVFVCVVAGTVWTGLKAGYLHLQVASVESLADEAALGVTGLRTEAARQREMVSSLTSTHTPGDVPAVGPLLADVQQRLEEVAKLLTFRLPDQIDQSNYVETEATINGYNANFRYAKNLLWRNREALVAASGIFEATQSFRQLIASQSYKDGVSRYPSLAAKASEAEQALLNAEADGGKEALIKIDQLRSFLNNLLDMDVLGNKITALDAAYKRMGLSRNDQMIIASMVNSTRNAIKDMDLDKAKETVDMLAGMVPYAEQELSIDIVSTGNSGIQRTYHAGRGQVGNGEVGTSTYAIVQATDAGGNVVRVPVNDAFTQGRKLASQFGVRISGEEFQRLTKDKADGQVDDGHIGDKPRNSLTIDWSPRTQSSHPSMIYNW